MNSQRRSNAANTDLLLWYAYLDIVKGKHKASHSKSVQFFGENMDKFTDLKAKQSSSVLETTMMRIENDSASSSGEAEASVESQTPVNFLSAETADTSHDSSIPLVSYTSPKEISD